MLKINTNKSAVLNNTDKNVGRAFADSLTREESRQQFYDKVVYLFLHERQAKMLVKNTTMPFLKRGTVLKEKVDFILSKLNIIPHFMSFETQLLTRPITAGYNWIKTPFSIFIGHYLTKFCNKFDSTLLDSTRSSHFGTKKGENVNNVCFLFTLDFKSLYTLSKKKGGFLFRKKRTFIPKIILTVFIFSILYRRRLCWVCWGTWPEGKNSAKNTSTASRTQRSTRVKKLQRLSLFQQQIRWNLCLVQTQRKKEKNEKSNWIFLFFFSLHGSPRRIIWVQQRYLKDFSINNQQIFIGSNLILRENKKHVVRYSKWDVCWS